MLRANAILPTVALTKNLQVSIQPAARNRFAKPSALWAVRSRGERGAIPRHTGMTVLGDGILTDFTALFSLTVTVTVNAVTGINATSRRNRAAISCMNAA